MRMKILLDVDAVLVDTIRKAPAGSFVAKRTTQVDSTVNIGIYAKNGDVEDKLVEVVYTQDVVRKINDFIREFENTHSDAVTELGVKSTKVFFEETDVKPVPPEEIVDLYTMMDGFIKYINDCILLSGNRSTITVQPPLLVDKTLSVTAWSKALDKFRQYGWTVVDEEMFCTFSHDLIQNYK